MFVISSCSVVIPYQVSVHTADKRGAGTDANVFINMFGERGDTGDRPLLKSSTNRNKFERKQVNMLCYVRREIVYLL